MNNLSKRILTGLLGILLIVVAIYLGGYYFSALCFLIITLGLWEFLTLFENKGFSPLKILSIIVGISVFIILIYIPELIPLILFLVFLLIAFELFRRKERNPINPFISLFGVVYIAIPLSLLSIMSNDRYFLLLLFLIIWSVDTFAFFGGKIIGKNKLTSISPNKTIEGSLSGFIFGIITSLVYNLIIGSEFRWQDVLIISVFVGVAGQLGDLFESMLKRFSGVKESSFVLPGHGGILDRFDGLIFSIPFVFPYYYFVMKNLN